MGEAFPHNVLRSDGQIVLGPHYDATLIAMGIDVATLPLGLFFTFCGDLMGASGEHYKKGSPISFEEACCKSSLNFSDDFMESLAMHQMREMKISVEPSQLMAARDHFLHLISGHFEKMSLTYSPWFGALFNARLISEYLEILCAHSSCGAAMRAAVMASDGLSNEQALPLFLLSHAHVESVEGGYMILGMARAFLKGKNFDEALALGRSAAEFGRKATQSFHKNNAMTIQQYAPLIQAVDKVLKTGDPYSVINNITEDGIETHFVVPAALWLVSRALALGDGIDGVRYGIELIVTDSLRIGGDPDTICSIAMGLYGLAHPEAAMTYLKSLKLGH